MPPPRRFTLGLLAALLVSPLGACGTPEPADPRPDVVLVLLDTLRPDHLELYGYERETAPFLTELGADGAVFLSAFSTSGWTPPATASTLTGLYPTSHGVVHGFETNERIEAALARGEEPSLRLTTLPAGHATLAERFRAAGYDTFGATTNVHVREAMGFDRGFERFWHREDASVEEVEEVLEGWSEELAAPRPSFVYLHLNDVHRPYDAREPWYDPAEGTLADAAARYDSEISYVDDALRRIASRHGWDEDALLCFVSDHGEAFGEHGMTGHGPSLHRPVNRVLFLLHGPGVPAVREDANVSLVDVVPTLLDAAGVGTPEDVEGLSLLPLLAEGTRAEARTLLEERTLFAHRRTRTPTYDKFLWSVVRGRWKAIHDEDTGATTLYDLEADPGELEDRASERDEELAALRAARSAFLAGARRPRGEDVEVPLDPELSRHLREMGYVGEDEP